MYEFVNEIIGTVEPMHDSVYGPKYRCSLTLKDGTFLPCAIIHSKQRLVALAKKRIEEESRGRGIFRGRSDRYEQILSTFVSGGNRINDYDVKSATVSKYAIPLSLLSQIHGETSMGWTGWVFRMNDGRCFSYGTSFLMEFFQLPDGYSFSDVAEVINHSFVNPDGAVVPVSRGAMPPEVYRAHSVFRERVFFSCAVDGI